jgi:hypothetical protein
LARRLVAWACARRRCSAILPRRATLDWLCSARVSAGRDERAKSLARPAADNAETVSMIVGEPNEPTSRGAPSYGRIGRSRCRPE